MSNSLIQYAYVSGEISPTLYSRSDLEKYDLGLALARNWIVDYRGGIATRAGSEYKEWLQYPLTAIRFFPFEFASNTANTNIVVFGDDYIRFMQEGNYVLEANQAISALAGTTVTRAAHGLVTDQLIKFTAMTGPITLLGRTFAVTVTGANTFTLRDFLNNAVSFAGLPAFVAGTYARVYTLANPYAPEDLYEMNVEQIKDLLRITHYKYATRDLTRLAAASWTLTETSFTNAIAPPIIASGFPSAVGTAGVCFTITTVDHAGNESLPAISFIESAIVNYSTTAGNFRLNWGPVDGAAYYNVYRSTISSEGNKTSRSQQLGFVGRAYGSYFLDTNIIPDFTKQPPQYNDPFANGAIEEIDVTGVGSGYTSASGIVITDGTGGNASAVPIVNFDGNLVGTIILNKGKNYTAPTIVADIGVGATFTYKLSSTGDNYPAVSAVFQQRQVYAGTLAKPLGIWGSRPGRLNNFDISPIIVDNDSYEFEVDTNKVALIRHLIPMRGGLLAMSDIGIWQLTGGNSIAVTPTNVLAEPQSYTGVSKLTPLKIETDLLYVESKGYTVRLLAYNDLAKLYAGSDISVLSAHFFGRGKEIQSWTFAQEPYKLVHACRADGYRLTGTLLKEQNVYAWTLASTQGWYRQSITIREENFDRVYHDVERIIGDKTVRFLELEKEREFEHIENAWCVDAGLALPFTYPAANITVVGTSVTASTGVFVLGDVGKVIYGGGGKAEITAYVSATVVTVLIKKVFTQVIPETTSVFILSGAWSLNSKVSTVSGLWHLEGKTVAVLADGSVLPTRTVVNGSITLDSPASAVVVGLSYRAIARTLPVTASGNVVEGKRKRVVGTAARVHQSRGLKTGFSLDRLYEYKDRTTETYGEPIQPRSELAYTLIETEWNDNGQFYYVVDDPLPVTILGHVLDLEIGDDPQ